MVAEEGERLGVDHEAVELVAVNDQQLAAVGGQVDRLGQDFDPAKVEADIVAESFVVTAGDIDDAGAVLGLFEDAATTSL